MDPIFRSIRRFPTDGVSETNVRSAEQRAAVAAREVRHLADALDRSLMVIEAMWVLMRDKLQLTDEQLADKINDIDLSDGVLDGRVRKTPVSCPSCHRTIARRFTKCMYCGQPVVQDPFDR